MIRGMIEVYDITRLLSDLMDAEGIDVFSRRVVV